MAHLHNFHKKENSGLFHTVGEKVKQGAEIAAGLKTIWEVGKPIVDFIRTAGPIAAAML